MKRIPIIIFCPRCISGGAHNYWLNLLEEEAFAQKVEMSVVAEQAEATQRIASHLDKWGIDVRTYRIDRSSSVTSRIYRRLSKPRCSRASMLNKEIEHRGRAVVWFILDGIYSIGMCREAIHECLRSGCPYHIIVQHAQEFVLFDSQALASDYRDLLQKAARVIFVSERNRRAVERALASRLENAQIGTNGLPGRTFDNAELVAANSPPQRSGPVRMLNLARFSLQHKGQPLLLEALASEAWRERSWECAFIGGGEHRWLLESLVHMHNFSSEQIRIADRTEDTLKEFGNCDLFVMPSFDEGMAFALVEAAACGRPLVATNVAGAPALVQHGITGWLAAAPTFEAVVHALEEAWANRDRWQEIGRNAQNAARDHFCLRSKVPKLLMENESDLNCQSKFN